MASLVGKVDFVKKVPTLLKITSQVTNVTLGWGFKMTGRYINSGNIRTKNDLAKIWDFVS